MKFIALFAFFTVCSASSLPSDVELDEHWDNFKRVFGKNYDVREEVTRRYIWEQNVADIVHHNLRADMGLHTFRKGINEFSDMSHGEFVGHLNGFGRNGMKSSNGSIWNEPMNADIPDRVDWTTAGLVTPVKNQGQCASSWAFSATGSLEGQYKKKTGILVSLSEQNLVDCSGPEGNMGCKGGLVDRAFEYIKNNNGISTESSYPYKAKDGRICHFNKYDVGATCSGYIDIPSGDENALKMAVATVGPVSAIIDASHASFYSYQSGIYDESKCSNKILNHGVLVVGYGNENGRDYWLVKNSWGTNWGLQGYIKMWRNQNNQCGIATQASYPLVYQI